MPDWTTERPGEPGFYWWRLHPSLPPEVVRLVRNPHAWVWFSTADDEPHRDSEKSSSLWWPVRLDPPPLFGSARCFMDDKEPPPGQPCWGRLVKVDDRPEPWGDPEFFACEGHILQWVGGDYIPYT